MTASALLLVGALPCAAAPSSGYIQTVSFGVNKAGKRVGQKEFRRVWFQGRNTRTETLTGQQLTRISVTGDSFWVAAPAAGRLTYVSETYRERLSYPEQVRRTFAQAFAKRVVSRKATVKGFPCWKYSWHEKAHFSGHIGSLAYDVTVWVYANKEFPVVLRYETSQGSRTELVDFKLNPPVSAAIFKKPTGLGSVVPFAAPQGKFVIAFETKSISTQYGWKKHEYDVFSGDGKQVTVTHRTVSTSANGEISTFAPPPEILDHKRGAMELWRRLQTPYWHSVKKIGRERLLSLPADILEKAIDSPPEEKSWVVDHPILGTVSLRRVTRYPGNETTFVVTRIQLGP